ncbi:RNA polymerase II degradation factor 1-like [Ctenocephalides felis]|uniref:RNA polymerase II degradation factor 1-like n=1 Tax=Ctenocephalides felis TaxID=7515 RepID=UPI000E6E104B|nr:RNA polymerase II degradation factor 1-like [Ctenocephalides felis]
MGSGIELKRAEFRKYLERSGVVEALTRALIALYSVENKPDDPVEFVKNNLMERDNDANTLLDELEGALHRVNELEQELIKLQEEAGLPPDVNIPMTPENTGSEQELASGDIVETSGDAAGEQKADVVDEPPKIESEVSEVPNSEENKTSELQQNVASESVEKDQVEPVAEENVAPSPEENVAPSPEENVEPTTGEVVGGESASPQAEQQQATEVEQQQATEVEQQPANEVEQQPTTEAEQPVVEEEQKVDQEAAQKETKRQSSTPSEITPPPAGSEEESSSNQITTVEPSAEETEKIEAENNAKMIYVYGCER